MRSGFGVVKRGGRARRPWLLGLALALASVAACGGDDASAAGGSPGRNDADGGKVAAAAAPGGPERRARTGATGRGRVLFVGTSLTAGLGLDPSEAYPAIVAEKIDSAGLPFEVVNAGVSGETSSGALRRIDWLLREPVDVVVIETGANDGLRGVPVATLRANVEALVDRIREARPDASILLVQMEALPNFGPEYTGAFRDVYQEVAEESGIALAPFLLEGVAGRPSLNQPDGIHPTAEGARLAAANIWASLAPLLEARSGALDAAAESQ